MELLKNSDLIQSVISHRKALEGQDGYNRLDIGAFYKKQVIGFLFNDLKELDLFQIQESEFDECTFKEIEFSGTVFYQTKFFNCIFKNCSFIKSDIQEIKFINCVFQNVNFFGCSLDGKLENCVFQNCKLDKMHLYESKLSNVVFTGETELPNLRDNEEYNVIWDISSPVSE